MRRYSAAAVCATDLQRTAAQVPGATNPNQASSLLQQIGTGVVSCNIVSKISIQCLFTKFMLTFYKKNFDAVIIIIILFQKSFSCDQG